MKKILLLFLIISITFLSYGQNSIIEFKQLTHLPAEYAKTEFDIHISAGYNNPYISREISLDMLLLSPSGKEIVLPCFFVSGDSAKSLWKSRFAAQEIGTYTYSFRLRTDKLDPVNSDTSDFTVISSNKNGFLHTNDYWTLKFDSGKLFRGIGENIGWESRSFEDLKWTYDYLLPTLSNNGANFFRTWMCSWNLPLEWQYVSNTNRYNSTDEYYNPGGIKKIDELVNMADSLGLFIMLVFDTNGSLWSDRWIENNSSERDPETPVKFITNNSAQKKYKDKLRYLIARWGYSTSIAAWEFYNEIDNGAFTKEDSILIPHSAITEWHSEMSRYLNDNDPYDHIITTSISHRDIIGMNSLPYIDINQKHIYKRTGEMRSEILRYSKTYNKPYIIGEFGYEWDWNIDFSTIVEELDYDYKRGLWYGLFSPTPILPMTWWWEFFDTRNMTTYFKSVREINDLMLDAGNGSFEMITAITNIIESYALKWGNKIFISLLNNSNSAASSDIEIINHEIKQCKGQSFTPLNMNYTNLGKVKNTENGIEISNISLNSKEELVLILSLDESDSGN